MPFFGSIFWISSGLHTSDLSLIHVHEIVVLQESFQVCIDAAFFVSSPAYQQDQCKYP